MREAITVALAKLRAHAKVLWAVLIAAGGLLVAALLVRRRPVLQTERKVNDIVAAREQKVEAAKAEAALRIEAAREREGTIKGQLAEVIKDKDGPRRRRNLIELSKMIDKGKRGE